MAFVVLCCTLNRKLKIRNFEKKCLETYEYRLEEDKGEMNGNSVTITQPLEISATVRIPNCTKTYFFLLFSCRMFSTYCWST